MRIPFTKMQGAGNDFVVLDETRGRFGLTPAQYNEPTNDAQIIYDGRASLNNGWANWGYGSTLNFTNTTPVHSGVYSISASMPAWSRIWFVQDMMDVTLCNDFTFWANGGLSGGQYLQVAASTNGVDGTWVNIGPLQANTWQQITVPLAALGVANATNLNYLWINNWSGSAQPVFYLDEVSLTAKTPPAIVNVGVNALQTVRTVDARVFGINAADWDGYINTPTTISILTDMNNQALRWPGGSGADVYFMSNASSLANTMNFIQVATNTDAQVYFTVNYGTVSTSCTRPASASATPLAIAESSAVKRCSRSIHPRNASRITSLFEL